jgi:hypothetical protein
MHKIWSLIAIILMVLITANCSASTEFPTGLFESDKVRDKEFRFNDDGTFILYWDGDEYLKGEYRVEGNNFYIEDITNTLCQSPATYEWSYDGEALYFEAIEEDCPPRRGNFNKKSWVMVENQ